MRQNYGVPAAFLGAGGYQHHIGLNIRGSPDGNHAPEGHTGRHHAATRHPDRAGLADALRRVKAAGFAVEGSADHDVSEAIYISDPGGNGVVYYCDRAEADWPKNEEVFLPW